MGTGRTTVSDICLDEVDFGEGIKMPDGILSVRWPGGVCLKLRNSWAYHLTIERDGYIYLCIKCSERTRSGFYYG